MVVRGVAKELTLGGVVSIGHRRQVRLEDVLVGIGRQRHRISARFGNIAVPIGVGHGLVSVVVVIQVFADVWVGFHGGHQDVGVKRALGDQRGVQRAGDVASGLLRTCTRVLAVGEAVGPPVDEAGGGQGFIIRERQHGTVNLLHLVAVLGGLGIPSR